MWHPRSETIHLSSQSTALGSYSAQCARGQRGISGVRPTNYCAVVSISDVWVDAFLELQIHRRKAAGRVPFGHSNQIPVRLYRIDRNTFYLFKRRYDHSLVETAGCAIALTAKPILATREVMVRRRRCM